MTVDAETRDLLAGRFGHNLRELREASGLSEAELGRRALLDKQEIFMLENGEREPRLATVMKLCGALEASIMSLVEGFEWNPGHFEIADTVEVESPSASSHKPEEAAQ